jgi:hypothetical protein
VMFRSACKWGRIVRELSLGRPVKADPRETARSTRVSALARFSLRDYLDRKVCTMFIAAHERDWWHWQEERVSRCKHCRSSMPDPFTETA